MFHILQKFSVAQIGFLNSGQAQALTDEQIKSLSPEQRAALDKHFGSVDANNGDSGKDDNGTIQSDAYTKNIFIV